MEWVLSAANASSEGTNASVQSEAALLEDAEHRLLLMRTAATETREQRYERSLALLEQLIQRYPEEAVHYSNRGLIYLRQELYGQALADLNRAIDLDGRLDQAYNNRASCYSALRRWKAALADYETAVDLNPLNIRARINLAITLREVQRYDAALDYLDGALVFAQMTEHIYAERGRTYHLRGDWNSAIADYNRALAAIKLPCGEHLALCQRVIRWRSELLSVD